MPSLDERLCPVSFEIPLGSSNLGDFGQEPQAIFKSRRPRKATDIKSPLSPGFLQIFAKNEKSPFPFPFRACGVLGSGSEHSRNRVFHAPPFLRGPRAEKKGANHTNLTHTNSIGAVHCVGLETTPKLSLRPVVVRYRWSGDAKIFSRYREIWSGDHGQTGK